MRVVGRLRGVVLAGSLAAVVAGCSGSDDGLVGEPLDLDGGGAPPDAGIDDDGSDALPGGSDDAPEGSEEPDYPPLPPIEPDPDLDLPIEAQADIAERHGLLYEATQTALATGVLEMSVLEQAMSPDLLESFAADIESRPVGHLSRSSDSRVAWVRLEEARDDLAVVVECRIIGVRTGTYDSDGVFVGDLPEGEVARVIQTVYEPLEAGSFLAVTSDAGVDEERCRG